MRPLLLICGFLICSSAAAKPTEPEIRFAPPPNWAKVSESLAVPENPRGPVFIRRQNFEIHIDESGQTAFMNSLIRLNDANSLQLGNIAFSWNPAAGKPVVHALRVYRDGTVRDVLPTTKFEILRREDQLEAAMLDGMLTATLKVPDLRIGDELEISYSLPVQDPTMGSDSYGLMFLADKPAPGRFSLRISWVDGQEPHLRPTADLASKVIRDPHGLSYSVDNPAFLPVPKDSPPRYAWQRIIEFSDFGDWPAVSRRFAPLFGKAATLMPNSAVKQEAARIAAAYSSPRERADAALKLVQQQVRYVYVGFNGGNLTPAGADETWQRRYGDCKGKTALLLALLNELGISARPVLVSNASVDDGLEMRAPSPAFFDHVLVQAKIDGKELWLDGTLPPVAPSGSDPLMPYRWVLPVEPDGSALERVEWKPATRPDTVTVLELDARAGFSEPARIHQTSITRGPQAILAYYQFSSAADEQLQSELKQSLEGNGFWTTVEKVTWRFDPKSLASILEITGTGPLEWEDEGNGSRSLTLPGGGFSPPARRQRSSDQDQSAPFFKVSEFECNVTTVRLPTATNAKDWSYNTSYNVTYFGQEFRRSFEHRDGSIRMIRANRSIQLELDPSAAAKDNARISQFDNSKAVIYLDPRSVARRGSGLTVPASYEVDWSSDDSACLATKAAAIKR